LRIAAVVLLLSGLLLGVRVMFFGVQRRVDDARLLHRRWPVALAAFLFVSGAVLYPVAGPGSQVTWASIASVFLLGAGAAVVAWWIVSRSAAAPSTDPEDDPRYRFQGQVARIVMPIGRDAGSTGVVAFEFDGKRYEHRACWTPEVVGVGSDAGASNEEVVIERIEGDLAFVEPWRLVEQRL